MLNKNITHLRKLKGYTQSDMATVLNKVIGAQIKERMYQTKDRVFSYERLKKPIGLKQKILDAYCSVFFVTENELKNTDLTEKNIKRRWINKPEISLVEEDEVIHIRKEVPDDIMSLLKRIEKKIDQLLKR